MLTKDTVLTEDLTCPAGDGLLIGAGGVALDCQGHAIRSSGPPGSKGLQVSGVSGTTIRNCVVSGFTIGLDLQDSPGTTLANSSLEDGSAGIEADRSPGLLVQGTSFARQAFHMSARDCDDARIERCHFEPRVYKGELAPGTVSLWECPRLRFLSNASLEGVNLAVFYGSDEALVRDNDLGARGRMEVYASANCIVSANVLGPRPRSSSYGFLGIEVSHSPGAVVESNVIQGERPWALFVEDTDGVRVTSNRISQADEAILIFSSSGGAITGNEIEGGFVGLLLFPGDGAPSNGNLVSGNSLRGVMIGLDIWDTMQNRFVGNSITGGWLGVLDGSTGLKPGGINRYEGNVIASNRYLGFFAYGTSPEILANQFIGNGNDASPLPEELDPLPALIGDHRGGLAMFPFASVPDDGFDDGSPLNDLLASPVVGGPGAANLFKENGDVDIDAIDTRAVNDSTLVTDNVFEADHPVDGARIRQEWFGLVKVEGPDGLPAVGAKISIQDATGSVVQEVTTGEEGFAPAGDDLLRPQGLSEYEEGGPVPTWPRFTESIVDRKGNLLNSTPHRLVARSGALVGRARYSWDGLDNDPDAYRSVGGRYQTARVRLGPGCRNLTDLQTMLHNAGIASDGVRNGLKAKLDAASRSKGRSAGEILCAIRNELAAQRGRQVPVLDSDDLLDCLQETAVTSAISLPCDASPEHAQAN